MSIVCMSHCMSQRTIKYRAIVCTSIEVADLSTEVVQKCAEREQAFQHHHTTTIAAGKLY